MAHDEVNIQEAEPDDSPGAPPTTVRPPGPDSSLPRREDALDKGQARNNRLVGALICSSVIIGTMVGVFSAEKLLFLYKDALHLNASAAATIGIITGIPSYIRPFMGMTSDLVPLFGFHRRPYYAISWLLAAAGFAALGLVHSYSTPAVITLLIVTATGANLRFVVMDAVMVAIGNRSGTVGRFQALQQGVPLLLGITFAGPLGGYVTAHWTYSACFLTAAAFSLIGTPLSLLIPERRAVAGPHPGETGEEHRARTAAGDAERARNAAALREAAKSPALWVLVAYVFYLIFTPGTNTAQFYYSVDVLHFSKQFLGNLGRAGSAGAILGLVLFFSLSRRMPVRSLVWGAYLMDCSIYLVMAGLRSHASAWPITLTYNAISSIYNLCLLTLAARACPPGAEGTIYGLVMSATYLAGSLGEKLGASIYTAQGPASHHSIAHGWYGLLTAGFLMTVVSIIFIPFLPAWAKSSEPLYRSTTSSDTGDASSSKAD